jgi:ADP-heptose:LPS heptosyltransferase
MAGLRLMIGADTGAMHLAVGVGCPTVTAFGPTPADKWGHDYAPHRVIRAPGGDMAALEPETLVRASLEALGEP